VQEPSSRDVQAASRNDPLPGAARLRLPLLDRLLDAEPDRRQETPPGAAQTLEILRGAVLRDLEALLNARRRRWPPPSELTHLPLSPLGYGIPDAAAGTFALEESREALAREIADTIRRFEPRLTGITVLPQATDEFDRSLRLRISATLRTDPVPESISFETVLETVTHEVRVNEA
jgi:type VI secretion system protein ImpF